MTQFWTELRRLAQLHAAAIAGGLLVLILVAMIASMVSSIDTEDIRDAQPSLSSAPKSTPHDAPPKGRP